MKKYECVIQDGPKDCGICSLLTIIKTYDAYVPKEYLREITNTTKDGVTAYSLIEGAKKIGFSAKGVYGDITDIKKENLPCIAHVIIDKKYKHFVVIHEIDKKKNMIVIADPAKGIIKMDIEKFKSSSSNNYIFLKPNKVLPTIKDNNEIKDIIINFLYTNKLSIIIVFVLSLIITIINIIYSFQFQLVLEKVISYTSKDNLLHLSFFIVFLVIFRIITNYYRNYIINFVNHKLDYILINNTFRHILLLPHLYYRNRTTGEIISRINDLGELRDSLSHIIVTFLVDLILLIFTLVSLFLVDIKLSLIIVMILLIFSFGNIIFNEFLTKKIRNVKEDISMVNSSMIELINASDTIKGMNINNKVMTKFSNLYNNYINESYKCSLLNLKKDSFSEMITSIVNSTVVILGGSYVLNGTLSIGKIATYNSLMYYLINPLNNLIGFDILLKKAKIVIGRINELLGIEEENLLLDTNKLDKVNGDIEIKKLNFSYNGSFNQIKNLSLKIKKGEKIILCGSSGSGKSTVAKILARYLEVKNGMVLIDNTDINNYNLYSLRKNITYVSQNEFLFTDTIYNNININNIRDFKRVSDVCSLFFVDEIVKKNKSGYNMLLEENGENLSGGEKERIILARTFLKESSVYILDETFSQIDPEQERKILKKMFERYNDKTVIVISHRYNNNDLYDKVINMEGYYDGNKCLE